MAGTIALEVEIAGDHESDESWALQTSVRVEGVDGEDVVEILLTVIEGLIATQITSALEEEYPLMNSEIREQLVLTQSRLMLIDEAIHLPHRPSRGIATSFPL